MHILTIQSHIAVLDPDSGLGILVLPHPVNEIEGWGFDDRAQPPGRVLLPWFGGDAGEYSTIMQQLGSIGWELPRDYQGAHAWFKAGSTGCCGKTMISLNGVDVADTDWPLPQLISALKHLQGLASRACCGHEPLLLSSDHATAEQAGSTTTGFDR